MHDESISIKRNHLPPGFKRTVDRFEALTRPTNSIGLGNMCRYFNELCGEVFDEYDENYRGAESSKKKTYELKMRRISELIKHFERRVEDLTSMEEHSWHSIMEPYADEHMFDDGTFFDNETLIERGILKRVPDEEVGSDE